MCFCTAFAGAASNDLLRVIGGGVLYVTKEWKVLRCKAIRDTDFAHACDRNESVAFFFHQPRASLMKTCGREPKIATVDVPIICFLTQKRFFVRKLRGYSPAQGLAICPPASFRTLGRERGEAICFLLSRVNFLLRIDSRILLGIVQHYLS